MTGKSSVLKRNLKSILENPKRLLAVILVANNLINIAIVIISTYIIDEIFDLYQLSYWTKFLMEIIIVTFMILMVGEVIPKIYATRKPLSLALFMTLPIKYMSFFLYIFVRPLIILGNLLEKILVRSNPHKIKDLSNAIQEFKNVPLQNKQILKGIISFGDILAKQVMKPRIDIVALSKETSYEDVLKVIKESAYSRIPVYGNNLDDIIGILYIKDILDKLNETNLHSLLSIKVKWVNLIREPYFVPENKKIDDLLMDFRKYKNHLAIVVDEYGGTCGLITMQDIIEEIIGEINDEFDEKEQYYHKLDENNYVFKGKTQLVDFYKILNIDEKYFESIKNADTLAGLLLEIAKDFPKKDQVISFKDYSFRIEDIDQERINEIKVTIKKEDDNKN